jgi:hypothetical protein
MINVLSIFFDLRDLIIYCRKTDENDLFVELASGIQSKKS